MEGTFTCEGDIHMWEVVTLETTFTCWSTHMWRVYLCVGDAHVWRYIHMWRRHSLVGGAHVWRLHSPVVGAHMWRGNTCRRCSHMVGAFTWMNPQSEILHLLIFFLFPCASLC